MRICSIGGIRLNGNISEGQSSLAGCPAAAAVYCPCAAFGHGGFTLVKGISRGQ